MNKLFERYTEKARRVMFFARHEASEFGSAHVEPEHLLLAVAREAPRLTEAIPEDSFRARLRKEPPSPDAVPAAGLPLSLATKEVLFRAALLADERRDRRVDCFHLLEALRRGEGPVAEFLAGCPSAPEQAPPEVGELARPIAAAIARSANRLRSLDEEASSHRLKRRGWTRKQALGHLIDLAAAHQQWVARALAEPRVDAVSYPDPSWAEAQNYDELPWEQLVDWWLQVNGMLVHAASQAGDGRKNIPCRIGLPLAVPLVELLTRYVARLEDVLGEILTHGDRE
ncbi:MAG: Clp protease N-terminal domain-containing protein [Bryobacteraceae bacterium]